MSTYIKLNKQEAFITRYRAHKSYSYTNQADRIADGIRFRLGTEITGSVEGDISISNLNRFFSSTKQLYYSNYTSSVESGSFDNYNQSTLHYTRSIEDNIAIISVPQFLYGENIKPSTFRFTSGSGFSITDDGEGNLFASGAVVYSQEVSSSVEEVTTTFRVSESVDFDNIPQFDIMQFSTPLTGITGSLTKIEWVGTPAQTPFFLQNGGLPVTIVSESNDLSVLSFSNGGQQLDSGDVSIVQFQDNGSDSIRFHFESSSQAVTSVDHLVYQSASIADGEFLGNIFYSHGIATLTKPNTAQRFQEQVLRSGSLQWKGSHTVYTHNYRCKVPETQLNFSQNPSTATGSLGEVRDFITGSHFRPYVTTVGLYNDSNELIAIGKMGQPIPKSKYMDMTFVIKFDV